MSEAVAPDILAPLSAPEAPPPPQLLTRLAARPYLFLALLGVLLWLPGVLSLPPLDRDESRFAQSSRQMVQSGDLVDIRFGQVPRYKKPAGIYWLQSASTAIAGLGHDDRIWTYRLPSLLGAIAAAWLTLWCALAFASIEVGLLSGLLLLGTVLLTAEATIATTDAVLEACILGVMGVLLRVYRAARDPDAPQPSTRLVLLGWVAFAAGVLVKGPVVLGAAGVTIVALGIWDRNLAWLKNLKPVRGVLLTLLLVLPWLIAITLQSRGAFFEQSLGNDFAAKIAGGQESHGVLPGYYLLLSALAFFPAILFVAPGIVQAIAHRADPAIRFLLAWAGGWWLLVELVPTKLPHYVLAAYPPLAILAALFVLAPASARFLAAARWIGFAQYLLGALALAVAPLLLLYLYGDGSFPWWVIAPAALGAVLALTGLVLVMRGKAASAVLVMLLAMFVMVPTLTAGAGPRLEQLWVTQRLQAVVRQHAMPGDPAPALAGYQEPSMLFAFGKDVVLADGAGAAEAGVRQGGLALVEDAAQGDFLARLAELQADASALGDVRGFNYSRGRRVHVTVYRVTRTPHDP